MADVSIFLSMSLTSKNRVLIDHNSNPLYSVNLKLGASLTWSLARKHGVLILNAESVLEMS